MRPVKRFSPREFALLCSPLLFIALAGWLLSRRNAPTLGGGPLRLAFRVEKPTVLEAFNGADAVLVVGLAGSGTDKMFIPNNDVFLKVQSPGALGGASARMGAGRSLFKSNPSTLPRLKSDKP